MFQFRNRSVFTAGIFLALALRIIKNQISGNEHCGNPGLT